MTVDVTALSDDVAVLQGRCTLGCLSVQARIRPDRVDAFRALLAAEPDQVATVQAVPGLSGDDEINDVASAQRPRLVNPANFLFATRDTGYKTTGLAVAELIDNSIQARADFLQDVRDPDKQASWREMAHRHAYAVPEGLVAVTELPSWSGLITVRFPKHVGDLPRVGFARNAPRQANSPGPLPQPNIMDAFWRASRDGATVKGYDQFRAPDDDPEVLRARIGVLEHRLELEQNRLWRAREANQVWQRRFSALDPPLCAACRQPLRLARGLAKARREEWEHIDQSAGATCQDQRGAADRKRWHDQHGNELPWQPSYVPPVRALLPGDEDSGVLL